MNKIILFLLCVVTLAHGQKGTYTSLEEAIKNPLNVRELVLNGKNVSELPDGVLQMKNLVRLSLPNNKSLEVTTLIKMIADLKTLRDLDISACDIAFLPKEIGELKHLRVLKLGANKLSSIPDEISSLTNLKELIFSQYPDDFRGFSPVERRKVLKLLPECKILLIDHFGGVHGNYRLEQKEVRVTSENVDSI